MSFSISRFRRSSRLLAPAPRYPAIPRGDGTRVSRAPSWGSSTRRPFFAPFRRTSEESAQPHGAMLRPAPQPRQCLRALFAPGRTLRLPDTGRGEGDPARPRRCRDLPRKRAAGKHRRVHALEHSRWSDRRYRQRLSAAVRRAAAPGAIAVLRSFGEPGVASPTNRAAEDRAMLWGIVDVRPAAAL